MQDDWLKRVPLADLLDEIESRHNVAGFVFIVVQDANTPTECLVSSRWGWPNDADYPEQTALVVESIIEHSSLVLDECGQALEGLGGSSPESPA